MKGQGRGKGSSGEGGDREGEGGDREEGMERNGVVPPTFKTLGTPLMDS